MPTFDEIAKRYAEELKRTKASLLRSELAKSSDGYQVKVAATAKNAVSQSLRKAFSELDAYWVNTETNRALNENDKEYILRRMDDELGVEHGTFSMLKKGSVEMTLLYQLKLDQLFDSIEFE